MDKIYNSGSFDGGDDETEQSNIIGGRVIDTAEYEASLLMQGEKPKSITGLGELNKALLAKIEGGIMRGTISGAHFGKNSRTIIRVCGKKHSIQNLPPDEISGSGRNDETKTMEYLAKKREYEKFISEV